MALSQGRFLTVVGVTTAICSAPVIAFSNLVATAIWPTWVAIAISETLRKVCILKLPDSVFAFYSVS